MSGPSVKELARVTDPVLRRLGGMIRRMIVSSTSKSIWKVIGVRGLDGNDEVVEAEVFTGVGFYARPRSSGGKPEAIMVNVGDARVPVIVGTRDEKTLAAVRAALGGNKPDAGEAVVYAPDGSAIVYLKTGGTVEARTPSGTAVALATKADVQALRDWAAAHTHPVATTGTAAAQSGTAAVSASPPASPTGTTVLKGQ